MIEAERARCERVLPPSPLKKDNIMRLVTIYESGGIECDLEPTETARRVVSANIENYKPNGNGSSDNLGKPGGDLTRSHRIGVSGDGIAFLSVTRRVLVVCSLLWEFYFYQILVTLRDHNVRVV